MSEPRRSDADPSVTVTACICDTFAAETLKRAKLVSDPNDSVDVPSKTARALSADKPVSTPPLMVATLSVTKEPDTPPAVEMRSAVSVPERILAVPSVNMEAKTLPDVLRLPEVMVAMSSVMVAAVRERVPEMAPP